MSLTVTPLPFPPLGTGYRPNFRMRPPPPADPPAGDLPSRGGSAWRKTSPPSADRQCQPTRPNVERTPGLPWQMTLHPSCARRRLLNPQAPPPDAAARAEAAGRHQTDGACLAGRHRRGSPGGGRGNLPSLPCRAFHMRTPSRPRLTVISIELVSPPPPLAACSFPKCPCSLPRRRTHAADHIRLTRNVGRW